ncbi:hypothetical protein PC121_g1387 [Phytophthora cactorum]|nr:hypothetical protein PC121_g1387 [Phytophthora cactorum]
MARGGRTNIKGFKKVASLKIRVAVSNQKKHDILRHIADRGLASAVDTYFPSLKGDKRKQKNRQLLRWMPHKAAIAKRVGEGDGALYKSRSKGTGCGMSREEEEQLGFGSWRKRFLDANRLSLRRRARHGQVTPDDARVVAEQFRKKVQEIIIEHNITEIYNADQTAMSYEHLTTHTIDTTGSRTVWVRSCGKDKRRMTVLLLAASSGKRHAPFVLFKQPPSRIPATEAFNHREQLGFGRTVWRSVKPMQEASGIEIYCNTKGWWNSKLALQWLEHHFAHCDSIDEEVLLIWDEFSGHWTEEVREYAASINVLLFCVPGGYTSVCQPADIAWMRPYKLRLREQWIKDIQEQFREHREGESQEADVTAFSPHSAFAS